MNIVNLACRLGEQQEANLLRSIVDTLRGHRSDSQGAAGNVLLPIDSSGISFPCCMTFLEGTTGSRPWNVMLAGRSDKVSFCRHILPDFTHTSLV